MFESDEERITTKVVLKLAKKSFQLMTAQGWLDRSESQGRGCFMW